MKRPYDEGVPFGGLRPDAAKGSCKEAPLPLLGAGTGWEADPVKPEPPKAAMSAGIKCL